METENGLARRVARLERMWVLSVAAALGAGVWLGSMRRGNAEGGAEAPKEIVLGTGDQRLELRPTGITLVGARSDFVMMSPASKRKVGIAVDDPNGMVRMVLQDDTDRTAGLTVSRYTELELQSEKSSVDLRSGDEGRIAAKTDAYTYAELTAKAGVPCWALGVKTGAAVRTCNDKK